MTYICSPYTKKRMTADQVGSLFIAVVARDDENEEPFAKGKEMVWRIRNETELPDTEHALLNISEWSNSSSAWHK